MFVEKINCSPSVHYNRKMDSHTIEGKSTICPTFHTVHSQPYCMCHHPINEFEAPWTIFCHLCISRNIMLVCGFDCKTTVIYNRSMDDHTTEGKSTICSTFHAVRSQPYCNCYHASMKFYLLEQYSAHSFINRNIAAMLICRFDCKTTVLYDRTMHDPTIEEKSTICSTFH